MISKGHLDELERKLNEFDGPIGGLDIIELIAEVRRLQAIEAAARATKKAIEAYRAAEGEDRHYLWNPYLDAQAKMHALLDGKGGGG